MEKKRGCYVVYADFQSGKCMTQQAGGRVGGWVGVMVSGSLTAGQMYYAMLGKQKDKAKNLGG